MVDFGTGRQIPLTNASPTSYATGYARPCTASGTGTCSNWNAKSSQQFASLAAPQSVTLAHARRRRAVLATFTSAAGNQFRTISSNPVCWSGSHHLRQQQQ